MTELINDLISDFNISPNMNYNDFNYNSYNNLESEINKLVLDSIISKTNIVRDVTNMREWV
jgi:hypothetical protein